MPPNEHSFIKLLSLLAYLFKFSRISVAQFQKDLLCCTTLKKAVDLFTPLRVFFSFGFFRDIVKGEQTGNRQFDFK